LRVAREAETRSDAVRQADAVAHMTADEQAGLLRLAPVHRVVNAFVADV
jgi:hypothetical protein